MEEGFNRDNQAVPRARVRARVRVRPVPVSVSVPVLRRGASARGVTLDIVFPQPPAKMKDEGSNNVKDGISGERALAALATRPSATAPRRLWAPTGPPEPLWGVPPAGRMGGRKIRNSKFEIDSGALGAFWFTMAS